MTERGDIVQVSGLEPEFWVVTGFYKDSGGTRQFRLASIQKDDSGFMSSGRARTSCTTDDSFLMHPLPGFEKLLATGADVGPILRELNIDW